MFFKFCILFLVTTASAFASNLPPVLSVMQSGVGNAPVNPILTEPLSNITNRVTLLGGYFNPTDGNYYSFMPQGNFGQAAHGDPYKVNAGKTAYCYSLGVQGNSATAVIFGYGDDAVTNSASAPTNAVAYQGSSNNIKFAVKSDGFTTMDFFVTFPSGKVPFVRANLTAGNAFMTRLDCIEM